MYLNTEDGAKNANLMGLATASAGQDTNPVEDFSSYYRSNCI